MTKKPRSKKIIEDDAIVSDARMTALRDRVKTELKNTKGRTDLMMAIREYVSAADRPRLEAIGKLITSDFRVSKLVPKLK